MKKIPEIIWLQVDLESIQDDPSPDEITWAPEQISSGDTCYIREDKFQDFDEKIRKDLLRILIEFGFSAALVDDYGDYGEPYPKIWFYKYTPTIDTVLVLPANYCLDDSINLKPISDDDSYCAMDIYLTKSKRDFRKDRKYLFRGKVDPFNERLMRTVLSMVIK